MNLSWPEIIAASFILLVLLSIVSGVIVRFCFERNRFPRANKLLDRFLEELSLGL